MTPPTVDEVVEALQYACSCEGSDAPESLEPLIECGNCALIGSLDGMVLVPRPQQVERHSDQRLMLRFISAREASEAEAMIAASEGE
jgi:hypothetical protein